MRRIHAAMALACLGIGCISYNLDFPPLRAFGNEPFWNVTISVEGNIVYSRLGEADIAFPVEAPLETDSTLVFGPLKDPTGEHRITVVLHGGPCQDTMADIVHPMLARVVIDGEELSGCARYDDPDALQETP